MNFKPALIAVAASLALNAPAALAEKWDMPMAYAATNYHSEHGVMFAEKVKEYTNGKMEITVHAAGSLFGGADIKRAITKNHCLTGTTSLSSQPLIKILPDCGMRRGILSMKRGVI